MSEASQSDVTNFNNQTEKEVFFERVTITVLSCHNILLDFSLTVKAAPHECVIRTSQP